MRRYRRNEHDNATTCMIIDGNAAEAAAHGSGILRKAAGKTVATVATTTATTEASGAYAQNTTTTLRNLRDHLTPKEMVLLWEKVQVRTKHVKLEMLTG